MHKINPKTLGNVLEEICSEVDLFGFDDGSAGGIYVNGEFVKSTPHFYRLKELPPPPENSLSFSFFDSRVDVLADVLWIRKFANPLMKALSDVSNLIAEKPKGLSYFEAGKIVGLYADLYNPQMKRNPSDKKSGAMIFTDTQKTSFLNQVKKMRFLSACGAALELWRIVLPSDSRHINGRKNFYLGINNRNMYNLIQYQGHVYLYPFRKEGYGYY